MVVRKRRRWRERAIDSRVIRVVVVGRNMAAILIASFGGGCGGKFRQSKSPGCGIYVTLFVKKRIRRCFVGCHGFIWKDVFLKNNVT